MRYLLAFIIATFLPLGFSAELGTGPVPVTSAAPSGAAGGDLGGTYPNPTVGAARFATPGAIGSGTPSTGAFTTVSATGAITSTLATGTAPFTVASTTNVANLNASSLSGATFAAPGAIGGGTPSTGAFTTISATGAITSTLATGTAPFTVASTTTVGNLDATSIAGGKTMAAPGAIGGGTPAAGTFTTLVANTVTDATSGSTGGISTLGGGGFTKAVWVGTNVTLANGLYAQTVDDAATATPTAMLTMSHTTSGTAGAGFGTGLKYNLEDDGGTNRSAGQVLCNWTTAVAASRTSSLQLQTSSDAGSVLTALTVQYPAAAGNLPSLVTTGTSTITGGVTDGYSTSHRFTPIYNGAFTVTRHNYIDLNQPTGTSTFTDACVFRFDAAIGTHKAVNSGTTKTSPGTVTAWLVININGTLHYIPCYASKTSMLSPVERAVRATIAFPGEPCERIAYEPAREAA